jgi:hypothetical protein
VGKRNEDHATRDERDARAGKRVLATVLAGAIGCAGLAWGILAGESGCQLQGSCDGDTVEIPVLPNEDNGPVVAPNGFPQGAGMYGNAWQSGPIEGHWLWFPGQRTYIISPQLPNDAGPFTGPYTFQAQISADPSPYTTAGSNFAPSAGNTTEFSGVLPDGRTNGFQVMNGTCSAYYLWLQVTQENAPDAGKAVGPSTDAAVAPTSDAGED